MQSPWKCAQWHVIRGVRQEGLNRGTALWSAVLSVVHLLKHRFHSLCLRCRVCWFSRMMLRVFTLWTISERRFYIIFSLDTPWILFGSSEGCNSVNGQTKRHWNKMPNEAGQDCEIKAVFWCGCDGCQTILECRT